MFDLIDLNTPTTITTLNTHSLRGQQQQDVTATPPLGQPSPVDLMDLSFLHKLSVQDLTTTPPREQPCSKEDIMTPPWCGRDQPKSKEERAVEKQPAGSACRAPFLAQLASSTQTDDDGHTCASGKLVKTSSVQVQMPSMPLPRSS